MHKDVRERLLAETLQYVVERVPFYRGLVPSRVEGADLALTDFPLIDQKIVAQNLREFLVLDEFPDYVLTSGGTTSGGGSISFRSHQEYEAVHYCYTGHASGETPDSTKLEGFAVDIFLNANGQYWRKPAGWPHISIALEQTTHAEVIKLLIQDGLTIRERLIPALHVQGQHGAMRALTGYYVSRGFFPRDFGLRSLLLYGGHVTQVWLDRFREIWGPTATTVYGLSEFSPGNAFQCSHCNCYHFWTCWPEFLALNSDRAVVEGDARLILTSLLPFSTLQHRIRYATGDIVHLAGHCSAAGQLGFRFRGRVLSSAIAPGADDEVILSEIDLLEVAEDFSDIVRQTHAAEVNLWSDTSVPRPPFQMGYPRISLAPPIDQRNREVVVVLETTFDPSEATARATVLSERFLTNLHDRYPDLSRKLVDCGMNLKIKLNPSGGSDLRIKATA